MMKSVFELQRQIRCCVVRSDARGVGRYGQLGGCQSDSYESGGSVPSRGGIGVDVKVVALGQDLSLYTHFCTTFASSTAFKPFGLSIEG